MNNSSENSDYSESNSDRAKQQRIIPNESSNDENESESSNDENESEHSLGSSSESDECDYNKKKYKLKSKRMISDSDSEDDLCKKKQKGKRIISDSEEEIKTSKNSPRNICLKPFDESTWTNCEKQGCSFKPCPDCYKNGETICECDDQEGSDY